ncbi:MAG: PAS domain S-box protein [Proteobacteria bacterium]|nr:PAS domain S-box protein [Pseudomonadota bacterium]
MEERLNSLMKAIRIVSQLIIKEKNRERLIQAVSETLVETIDLKSAWIALTDSSEKLIHIAESGLGENLKQFKKLLEKNVLPVCAKKALAQNKALITLDISIECRNCLLKPLCNETNSFASILKIDGKKYGILTVSMAKNFTFDKTDQVLFQEITDIIAFGLYNIDLSEKQNIILKDLKNKYYDALKESEERFRALFEHAPDAYFLHDIKSFRYVDCNLAAQKLTGYTKEEIIGNNYLQLKLLPQEQLGKIATFLEQLKCNLNKENILPYEIRANRKDGTQVFVEARTFALQIGGKAFFFGYSQRYFRKKKSGTTAATFTEA